MFAASDNYQRSLTAVENEAFQKALTGEVRRNGATVVGGCDQVAKEESGFERRTQLLKKYDAYIAEHPEIDGDVRLLWAKCLKSAGLSVSDLGEPLRTLLDEVRKLDLTDTVQQEKAYKLEDEIYGPSEKCRTKAREKTATRRNELERNFANANEAELKDLPDPE